MQTMPRTSWSHRFVGGARVGVTVLAVMALSPLWMSTVGLAGRAEALGAGAGHTLDQVLSIGVRSWAPRDLCPFPVPALPQIPRRQINVWQSAEFHQREPLAVRLIVERVTFTRCVRYRPRTRR